MRKPVIHIILILFTFFHANAQEKLIHKMKPDHVTVQFAGNIGVLSAGIGYSFFSGKMKSDLLYGLVPEFIGGANIHTIANKNTFKLFQHPDVKNISFSIGFSLNYTITNNTFLFLPKQYPDGHYAPNAIRFAPLFSYNFVYTNQKFNLFNTANIYFEVSTLDNYLWDCIKTTAIDFTDIWNLAIGTTIQLYEK